jgi:hypothetical protein
MGGEFEDAEPVEVRFVDEIRGTEELTLTPDGWIRLPKFPNFYGYADGVHHWTEHERRKDRRLRAELAKCGLPSIGIDSPLLESADYVSDVIEQLTMFAVLCRMGFSVTWQFCA